jgi:hypothetical protein
MKVYAMTCGRLRARKIFLIPDAETAFLIHGHDPDQWEEIKKAPDYYG